ncbi:MAG: GntR family transcriptional regulator [Treponema sp.]|jgi:DNA-binding LacI/PurR family transcriptional regulator|nr:GntR family transcriptional regulator [Treponema sp.]
MVKSGLIYQDLLERITGGDLAGKIHLPSENHLAAHYGCSRPTIRKAIGSLRDRGLVSSAKGSCAYITGRGAGGGVEKPQTETFMGIIFPNMGPEFFFDYLGRNLAQHASEQGYSLVWGGYLSPRSDMLKMDILGTCERFIAQKIQGVFFAPFGIHPKSDLINNEIVESFSAAGIPIVLLDADIRPYPDRSSFNLVSLDNFQAGYLITSYMIRRGLRRLFFLAPPYSHNSVRLRYTGFREAILDSQAEQTRRGGESLLGEQYPGTSQYMELNRDDNEGLSRFIREKKPDGILCSNDLTAMSALRSFEAMGIRVPGDISLASFDNLSRQMLFPRFITSIEQPIEDISRSALSLMINLINSPKMPPWHVTFPGILVAGDSTI